MLSVFLDTYDRNYMRDLYITVKLLIIIVALSTTVLFGQIFAQGIDYSESSKKMILEQLSTHKNQKNLRKRALGISESLLGFEYEVDTSGEGSSGVYDDKPLIVMEKFDCTTFVEAVLALTFSQKNNMETFLTQFKNIKYVDASEVTYVNRNHFTSLHWFPNMIKKQLLVDITEEVGKITHNRMKWLDLDGWYGAKIKTLQEGADGNAAAKIKELEKDGPNKQVSNLASLSYISLERMLARRVIRKLKREKIVVFNMVKNEYATGNIPVIVGHQGFIVNKKGELFFRHASSSKNVRKTVDIPYKEYIEDRMTDSSWPTLGFNIMGFKK